MSARDPVAYADRAARHLDARDREVARSRRISRLRLATFLPGAGGLLWWLSRGPDAALIAGLLLIVGFAALVVWQARVDERAALFEALRLVNVRALARVTRDWDVLPLPAPPPGIDLTKHPYALDLDLFGRASLAQWLWPPATVGGGDAIGRWLLYPASRDEILQRQTAIAELSRGDQPGDEWRERLAANGILAGQARRGDVDRLLAWAEGGDSFGSRTAVVRISVYVILALTWGLLALHASRVLGAALWSLPLLLGIVLSFSRAQKIQDILDRAGNGQEALRRYAVLLELAGQGPAAGAKLAALRDRLRAGGADAPRAMARLNAILGFGQFRSSAVLLHVPVQIFTLWDFHVLFALDRWRRANGPQVRGWLDALAELDALALLATAHRDNPSWTLPEIATIADESVARNAVFSADAIGHPLLPDARRVVNDVTVGPQGTLLLVTGSNMSGKSTLLRTIGLNAVLAQAGGCVCAARLRMPECDLQTSIRVQDSLELGLSYFMAALARLKGVVDAAQHERRGRVLLYLLDEILQGTNSVERGLAVRAVARHLLGASAIGVMTTHDLALAGEEPLASAASLVHFTETVDAQGVMRFDYTLRPGIATSRNALRLMQLIGIEP